MLFKRLHVLLFCSALIWGTPIQAQTKLNYDVNGDGCFTSEDLTVLFKIGKYNTASPATYTEGDFNGDGVFDASDLILAFQSGLYDTCQPITPIDANTPPSPPNDESQSAAWIDPGIGRDAVQWIVGDHSDTISYPTGDQEGSYAWEGETGWELLGENPDFLPFAGKKDLPTDSQNWISFQSIITATRMDFFIPSTSRFIALEYKDNLFSPRLDPYEEKDSGPGVRINGTLIGRLEALRDHRWKRVVIELPRVTSSTSSTNIRVEVGRGTGHWGETHGSLLLHRIIASPNLIPQRDSVPGYWPKVREVLSNNQLYDRGGKPYVPLILSTLQGYIAENQIDSLDLLRANTNFSMGHHEGSGQTFWEENDLHIGDERVMGIATKMAESIKKGYFTVPWHFSDTQGYFIRRVGKSIEYSGPAYRTLYNGTWNGVVNVWKAALEDFVKGNSHVPFVYLKDELDHTDQEFWGAFEEMALDLRQAANQSDPTLPTMITMMGWKPLMLQAGFELADIVASDRYPVRGIDALERVAEWNEELRRVSHGKPFIWVMTLEPKSDIRRTPTELRSLSYIALAHGARGLWYFGDRGSMRETTVQDFYRELGNVISEIATLQDIIHGSAHEVARTIPSTSDRYSENFPQSFRNEGMELSTNDGIAATLRRSSSRTILLSVNERNSSLDQTFKLPSLHTGDIVQVLFENRSIRISEDGILHDSFGPYERHVYQLP